MGIVNIQKTIRDLDVGVPGRINGSEYLEYSFPYDIHQLSLDEIGDWSIKLSGWEGYVLTNLGKHEAELILIKGQYELAIYKYQEEKMTVKAIEAKAVESDELLRKAKKRILELEGTVQWLNRIATAYKNQREALSREQSRRSQEQGR